MKNLFSIVKHCRIHLRFSILISVLIFGVSLLHIDEVQAQTPVVEPVFLVDKILPALELGNEYYLSSVTIQGKLRPKLGVRSVPPPPTFWEWVVEEIDTILLTAGAGAGIARGNHLIFILTSLFNTITGRKKSDDTPPSEPA